MKIKKLTFILPIFFILLIGSISIFFISKSESAGNSKTNQQSTDWHLAWSDDFNGTEINKNNWTFDTPDDGRYNGEQQSYTDKNAYVKDGHLVIVA
jgi:beta-glucanase (GH16 family)